MGYLTSKSSVLTRSDTILDQQFHLDLSLQANPYIRSPAHLLHQPPLVLKRRLDRGRQLSLLLFEQFDWIDLELEAVGLLVFFHKLPECREHRPHECGRNLGAAGPCE